MAITIRFNKESILKKLNEAAIAKSKPIARSRAFFIFKRAQDALLRDFDQHPVTLELRKGGESGVPLTNATDGYGNLFAFIGFDRGSDPTKPLREILESLRVHTGVRDGRFWKFAYDLPSQKAIEVNSQMPWENGNSWVSEIEGGTLSNLSHFLYKKFNNPPSRSTQGIQLPYEVNEDLSFQKTPYLTEILKNFRERVNITKEL